MLHAIERMGMRAVEIATDPHEGIDLGALSRAIERQSVAACMVMPNFQKGWKPAGWTPAPSQAGNTMITSRHVHVKRVRRIPQFWLIWTALA